MTESCSSIKKELNIQFVIASIKKWFKWIVLITLLVSGITVATVIFMKNIYQSCAVLKPVDYQSDNLSSTLGNMSALVNLSGLGNSNSVTPFQAMNAIISDNKFMSNFIKKNKFEPYVFNEYSELKSDKKFLKNQDFYIRQAMQDSLIFSEDKKSGLISLAYQNKNRAFTKLFVDKLLIELSNKYKSIELHNIQSQIDSYKEEINNVSDITLKNKLADTVSNLIQKKIFSRAHDYYGFNIMVSPIVPDELDKVKPSRGLICVFVFVMTIIVSTMSFTMYDYFRKN